MHITAVFAIIKRAGRILLVKNRDKKGTERWTLPGGKVEKEETLYDALCREVWEETKYIVKQAQVAYIHEAFFTNVSAHVRAIIFHSQIDQSSPQESLIKDPDKVIISKKWVFISDLPKYINNEKILSSLQEWLSHLRTSQYFITEDMRW
ncbi:MAG TPA: NUDIX hydrolase [Candidatus Rhabdochlamydia sp.]|jgi:ADP-ribose pyrophosphatase YjhB (NUDIX family)|nr:NUDIX hydrolase [Candidatus Rhabdochlamydia sp.]